MDSWRTDWVYLQREIAGVPRLPIITSRIFSLVPGTSWVARYASSPKNPTVTM